MKESDFSNQFILYLRDKFPLMYGYKVHGSEMQRSGLPDNTFCINGLYVAIEFKIRRDYRISITPFQLRELKMIHDANGIGLIVAYDEDIGKILLRYNRVDYRKYLENPTKKTVSVKMEWDFQFNTYEEAVELFYLLIANKGEL